MLLVVMTVWIRPGCQGRSPNGLAYNDNGPIMRACADIYGGAGAEIVCTDWY